MINLRPALNRLKYRLILNAAARGFKMKCINLIPLAYSCPFGNQRKPEGILLLAEMLL